MVEHLDKNSMCLPDGVGPLHLGQVRHPVRDVGVLDLRDRPSAERDCCTDEGVTDQRLGRRLSGQRCVTVLRAGDDSCVPLPAVPLEPGEEVAPGGPLREAARLVEADELPLVHPAGVDARRRELRREIEDGHGQPLID
jgi:hypothetical protein